MHVLSQSPKDPDFVQNPYPFYERARAAGPFFHWSDYNLTCTGNAASRPNSSHAARLVACGCVSS